MMKNKKYPNRKYDDAIVNATLFLIIIQIMLLTFIIITAMIIVDSVQDNKSCDKAMHTHISQTPCLQDEKVLYRCYANEDFFKLNFGNNLECNCFYKSATSVGQANIRIGEINK